MGELNVSDWPDSVRRAFLGWSDFPGVYRDISVVVDEKIPAKAVLDQILADKESPLARAQIFDLFRGGTVPSGQKSLSIRLFFQSHDRTLTDELVNGYFSAIADRLAGRLAATLRS
jgi:phenylalanyl-tRNA synthetase beta chain